MKNQPFLDKELFSHSLSYGGVLRKKRKGRNARPLSPKDSIHLVLKGTLAKKEWSFRLPKNHQIVSVLLNRHSKAYGIRIDQKAIQGDHIHLLLRVRNRSLYKRFIRSLSGQIAMLVTDARNATKSLKKEGLRFFKYRPFTRVVKGWKPYQTAKAYLKLNEQEALGNIPYRKQRLKDLEAHEWHFVWT
ncbi:MAG: transposase [Pseudobdellovibrionaceae bacterium]